jgi:hypothetical protein
MRRLFSALTLFLSIGLSAMLSSAFAFQSAGDEALQQKFSGLQSFIASNRAALTNYKWTEDTVVLLSGQVNTSEQRLCRFGREGKILKTLVIDPQDAPRNHPHGLLRSRAVEKSIAETRDYITRLESLTGDYLPPSSERLRSSIERGNASLADRTENLSTLTINGYLKPGDKVFFEAAGKKIRTVHIDTYLDDRASEPILLTATFATLPDGTSYVAESDLKVVSRNMEIKTVSSQFEMMFH